MHGATFLVLLASFSEVSAGPVLGNPGLKGMKYEARSAPFRPNPVYQAAANHFAVPQFQQVPQLSQQRSVASMAKSDVEDRQEWIAKYKAKMADNIDTSEFAGKNIFGTDLQSCSPDEECTYTADSPQICVGLTPRERYGAKDRIWFSDAKSFELKPPPGQFKWKPEYKGQCVPFFEFGSDSFMKGLRFGAMDLVPKCAAIPSSIFTSEYSLDLWQNCMMEAKEYKYVSSTSSKYQSDSTVTTKKDPFFIKKPSLKEDQPDLMSPKCMRFRQGIERLATLCEEQAGPSDMQALTAMKASMGAVALPSPDNNVTSIAAVALVFFVVGSAVSFAVFRSRRQAIEGDEKLLG